MARYAGLLIFAILQVVSLAVESSSVMEALKTLPKQELNNLALIVAHDGDPLPDRWHFLVYDPNAISGVREYVVERGELIAARGVSQFAEVLTPADVINNQTLRIDAEQLAGIVKDYASANNVTAKKISYQLRKKADQAEPVWWVNCADEAGKTLGTLAVAATTGSIVSYQGFQTAPKIAQKQPSDQERGTEKTNVKRRARADTPEPAQRAVASSSNRRSNEQTDVNTADRRSSKRRTNVTSNSSRREMRISPTYEQPPPVAQRPRNPFQNIFRKLLSR